MADVRDTLVSWLRDAHAMESAAVSNLEKNIDRFEGYPAVQQKFREDLSYTRQNTQEIEQCLDRLGADRSTLKDLGMKFAGVIQPYLGAASGDEVVKHLLAAHAYEEFEVASYRSLATAAEEAGDIQLRDMCERSASQKKEMADWLEANLPGVTRQYLATSH